MSERHGVRGVLAGVAGGLVASWVMNQFMGGPGKKLTEAVQTPEENRKQAQHADDEDATMKAADAIVNTVTGGRHLSRKEKETDGPIVHYVFGALMGGVYGGLAEFSPVVRSGFGTSFASVLFAGGDLVAIPALGLSVSPAKGNKAALVTPYAAHLVYGLTTELVRRLVRKVV